MKQNRKRLLRLLRDERGFSYVETLVTVIVAGVLLTLLVNIVGIGADYIKLAAFTNSITDAAATTGTVDTDSADYLTKARQDALNSSSLNLTWNAQYFDSSSGRLAFRQPFIVTATYNCRLPLFFNSYSNTAITIPLTYVGMGTSGVFWK